MHDYLRWCLLQPTVMVLAFLAYVCNIYICIYPYEILTHTHTHTHNRLTAFVRDNPG